MFITIYDSVLIVFFLKAFAFSLVSFSGYQQKEVVSSFWQATFSAFTVIILRCCFYCKSVVTENVAADYIFRLVVILRYAPLREAVFFSCLLTEFQDKADIWNSFILNFANFWALNSASPCFFCCIEFILTIQKWGSVLKLVMILVKI